jgi:hypothetical protein
MTGKHLPIQIDLSRENTPDSRAENHFSYNPPTSAGLDAIENWPLRLWAATTMTADAYHISVVVPSSGHIEALSGISVLHKKHIAPYKWVYKLALHETERLMRYIRRSQEGEEGMISPE